MNKTLAASFLVTVGAVACGPPGPPPSPPPPPPATVEPTPEPAPPVDPVDPPEPTGGDTGDLPQPGPNDQVVTKKDGTCWVMPEVDCPPPPATCNPPPPMQVACPEDK